MTTSPASQLAERSRAERALRVAAEVRAEVARQGIARQAIAEELGLSEARLSLRMNGHVEWKISELLAVADVLKVSVTKFLPAAATTP
jgi:transcriptional regulator with XRE-family HTH domain